MTVRMIFNMYLDGASMLQIKTYLEENGVKTPKGKDQWSIDTLFRMLRNEKYVGDVIYQKTFCTDPISKKQVINRGERDKYLVSNNHPAIIDRDTFTRVQTEIARRSSIRKTSDKASTELGKYSARYALSEILICGECGSPYKRKTWTCGSDKRIYWRCLSRIEHGTKYCKKSKGIEEKKLHSTICRALKRGIEENREVYSLIEANLTYAVSGQENAFDAFSLEQSIAQKQAQAGDLVKLSLKSEANVEKYESEIAKIYSEIKTLRDQLKQAQKMTENAAQTNEEVARLSGWLANHDAAFEEYDDVVVRRLVETIRVNRDDTITLTIKGGVSITEKVGEDQKSD